MSHENIMRLWNGAVDGGILRPKTRIVVKTSSYTITASDFGSVFTTRGATAPVTFTLPTAGSTNNGEWVLFVNIADQNMIVAGDDDGLVVFNDLTANNIGYTTAGELIGGTFFAVCDGTSWIVLPIGTETQTIAVDTSASSTPSASATPSATPSATKSSTPSATPSSTKSSTPSATPSNSPS